MFRTLSLAVCSVMLTACTLAPEYNRPEMAVPHSMPQGAAYTEVYTEYNEQSLELANFVKDERLAEVIDMAVNSNRSLRSQIAAIEEARAAYRITRADLLPSIGGTGSAGRGDNGITGPTDSYSLSVGLNTFEIDLFGKTRSLKDAALERYLAAESTVQAAKISLIGETINVWITLAADKEQLKLSEETMKSAFNSVELTRSRYEAGISSKLDLLQAETIYYQTKADVASNTTLVAQDLNALTLLVGESIDESLLPNGFEGSEQWLGMPSSGLSSEVLLRRPDIAAAEHTLKAANANIGAARAAFFPSISLTGSAGYSSSNLSDLFDGNIWSFAGVINLPIFTGGANKANLDASWAALDGYLATYDYTIQAAFKEVADTLARRGTIDAQIEAQAELFRVSEESYALAENRYTLGLDTYINMLESQRTYYNAERALISMHMVELSNRVALYKALGGGTEKVITYTSQR